MGAIKVAIIGGPSIGKTAIINFLTKRYTVFKEAAREILIHDPIFKGKTATQAQSLEFQKAIWQMQTKQFKKSKKLTDKIVFFDRGIPDSFVYLKLKNIKFPDELTNLSKELRYDYIFSLASLPFYIKDNARTESKKEAQKIGKLLEYNYKKLGYHIVKVPFNTIKKRARFILSKIKEF